MKNLTKTETVMEFLSRGGKINKCPTRTHRPLSRKEKGYRKEVEVVIEPDMAFLPTALKIKYGIKDGR